MSQGDGIAHYVHGTASEEQRRLAAMNDLINAACLRELRLGEERSVLDVGSGLGQLTRALARALGPGARVVGIERDERQIAAARRLAAEAGGGAAVEFRHGEAASPPLAPHEWGSFDLAHARYLLEHHPDPGRVVERMVQALRPGGRIVLADDDHELLRLWPEPPGLQAAWRAYVRAYDRLGNDPYVGRRLVELLVAAGARPLRVTFVFYGACAGEAHFPGIVDNLRGILGGARETVVGLGLLDRESYDRALAELERWRERPDAAFWYAINWAEGERRALP